MLVVSFLIFLTFELSSQNVAKTALGQFATKAQLDLYNKQHCLTDGFSTATAPGSVCRRIAMAK